MGFAITPETIAATARDVGETTIISRAGGAPTLAVGMAHIFSRFWGGRALMAFWYHFAILFEALFILTAVDAGTRACRFMLQDLIGLAAPSFRNATSFTPALTGTLLCVASWGFFLHQGVTDPLGGVNTLWPLFGIANQMLAAIALTLATVVLFRMKRARYAWVTIGPTVWLLVCTLTAGALKLFSSDVKVGFLAHAGKFEAAIARGEVLAPAGNPADMRTILFNDRVDAVLTAAFMLVVIAVLLFGVRACIAALRADRPTMCELPADMVSA
jgi:carbon starvation protein